MHANNVTNNLESANFLRGTWYPGWLYHRAIHCCQGLSVGLLVDTRTVPLFKGLFNYFATRLVMSSAIFPAAPIAAACRAYIEYQKSVHQQFREKWIATQANERDWPNLKPWRRVGIEQATNYWEQGLPGDFFSASALAKVRLDSQIEFARELLEMAESKGRIGGVKLSAREFSQLAPFYETKISPRP